MKRQRKGEILASIVILLLLFSGSVLLINHFFRNEVIAQQKEYLEKKGKLLIRQLSTEDGAFVYTTEELAGVFDEAIETDSERITLLDGTGLIIYDTFDPQLTGERNERPEVKAVLDGSSIGTALRTSDTLNKELLYVALPIKDDQQQRIGVLRIAETTVGFSAKTDSFRRAIILTLSFLFSIIGLMIWFLIRKKNRPLETVLPVLKKMTQAPYHSGVIMESSSQWEELYHTINTLSEQMRDTYQAYTSTENQFQTLLRELVIGVFIIDSEDHLELMNPKMMEHLGIVSYSSHEPYAAYIRDPQLVQLIHQATPETPYLQKEIRLSVPFEQILDVTLHLMVDGHDQQRLIGVAYDLTRVRQLEKMQKDFVGNVSHELKTPVTSLVGFTETLLDGAKNDPAVLTEFLEIMHKDALRLQDLIQDILQLSKTGRKLDYQIQTIELNQFFHDLVSNYQSLIDEKNLKVTIEGIPTYFRTKLEFFYPIAKNLIENALHYSPPDTTITIRFQLQDVLQFSVEDTGIGISLEDQERIFERFYRVDRARSRHSGGTGLGLAIVKDYTASLEGWIELISHPNVGSTFTIYLPLLDKQ